MKTVLITQARTASTRLPEKVLLEIDGVSLLEIHLKRLKKCKNITKIIVATTINEQDDRIVTICDSLDINVFRGSEQDVLDRFYQSVRGLAPEWVVRVTSDCPLIDPKLVDAVIACAQTNEVDYCSNTLLEDFPDGQDVEVFKFAALKRAWNQAALKSEREHVTSYIKKHSTYNGGTLFSAVCFPSGANYSHLRMTVDEEVDYKLIEKIVTVMGINESWLNYARYVLANNLDLMNKNIIRNEGFLKSLKND